MSEPHGSGAGGAWESEGAPLWVGATIGCGAFFLLGLCAIPVGLYYAVADRQDEPAIGPEDPALSSRSEPRSDEGLAPAPSNPTPAPAPPGLPSPGLPPPPAPPSSRPPPGRAATPPYRVRVQIEHVEGLTTLRAGDPCEFDVARYNRPDGTFWCHADIRCGGSLLYGGARQGYFDCSLILPPHPDVVGHDHQTTTGDGDAELHLDTPRREFRLSDDASGVAGAFEVRGRVESVRQ